MVNIMLLTEVFLAKKLSVEKTYAVSGLEHFIVGSRVSGVLLSLYHGDRKA